MIPLLSLAMYLSATIVGAGGSLPRVKSLVGLFLPPMMLLAAFAADREAEPDIPMLSKTSLSYLSELSLMLESPLARVVRGFLSVYLSWFSFPHVFVFLDAELLALIERDSSKASEE